VVAGGHGGDRRGGRGLATPRAAGDHDLLEATNPSSEPRGARQPAARPLCRGSPRRRARTTSHDVRSTPSDAQLFGQRGRHLPCRAQAVGAREQVRRSRTGVDGSRPLRRRSRCAERVLRMVTARRAPSSTGSTSPPPASLIAPTAAGWRSSSKTASSEWPKSSGKHPVHDPRGEPNRGLQPPRVPRARGSRRPASPRASSPATSPVFHGWRGCRASVGLRADEAHLDQLVDGLRCGQLAHDVPRRRRVDDDEVVVALRAHRSRACRRSGSRAHPGRRCHEVEGLASGPILP